MRTEDDRPPSSLRNLGPVSDEMLAEVGVTSAGGLARAGAEEAWRRLKFRYGRHVGLVFLYALEGALSNRDWRDLDPDRKEALRRFAKTLR